MNSKYISFTGVIATPDKNVIKILNKVFPQQIFEEHTGHYYDDGEPIVNDKETGYRMFRGKPLEYSLIDCTEWGIITVRLSKIGDNIGHLVVECREGGWAEETFCLLDKNQMPIKASDFNPNPIKQLL